MGVIKDYDLNDVPQLFDANPNSPGAWYDRDEMRWVVEASPSEHKVYTDYLNCGGIAPCFASWLVDYRKQERAL